MARILKCKEDRLEVVFGGNFCQLHKVLPTIVFFKVQVHSTKLKIEMALEEYKKRKEKKKVTCDYDVSQILC